MLTMLVGRRPRMQRCNANDPSMPPFGRSRLSWPALSTATPANDKLLKEKNVSLIYSSTCMNII